MQHTIVMFSGGVSSFFAARRVIEQGAQHITLLFADTRMEDDDLYRFLRDSERYFNLPITRIAEGRTPWEIFRAERFLGNPRIDPCSRILKRRLLMDWCTAHCDPDHTTLVYGLSWEERHRATRHSARMAPWVCRFPLCEKPWMTKTQLLDALEQLGIPMPRLYRLGFAHNNCGGACVKAGQAQWARLWETMPARYLWHERHEEALRQELGEVSILRDRRGGTTRTLTLRQFRQQYLTGVLPIDQDAWGGCGCAIDGEARGDEEGGTP